MASSLYVSADPNAFAQAQALGGMGTSSDLTLVPAGFTAPCVVCTGGYPETVQVLEVPTTAGAVAQVLASMAATEGNAPPTLNATQQLAQILVAANVLTAAQAAPILTPAASSSVSPGHLT